MKNPPSDIKSKALRDTYYMAQNILAERYEATLSKATDKETRKALKEKFNKDIQYYCNME